MYIQLFDNITKKDIEAAGGKGANLGEMTRAVLRFFRARY